MSTQTTTPLAGPRLLRPVAPPLGSYYRPGRNDHGVLLQLLSEGHTAMSGVVFDPCLAARQEELRTEVQRQRLETILDSRSVELATPGGILRKGIEDLPWAGTSLPHTPASLAGAGGDALVDPLADYVVEKNYSAVLAPTHFRPTGGDRWGPVDGYLTRRLRRRLDSAGKADVPIYYPLAVSGAVLRDDARRAALIADLSRLPIDAVWLRVHPFGTTASGPLALRRYIEACREMHALDLPLVAERTGTVGLALLAFGAVGGIESGITLGERYNVTPLLRPPSRGTPFSPSPRVYLPDLGTFLSKAQAESFLQHRQMRAAFACRDTKCCPRGAVSMTSDPRRHFILRRDGEISTYSRPPGPVRSGLYLEDFLRPATDLVLRAVKVEASLETTRRRLESWRHTLGAMQRVGAPTSFAPVPQGRRLEPQRGRLGA